MSKHCRKLKALTTTSDLASVFLQTPERRSHLMVSLAQLQYDPAVYIPGFPTRDSGLERKLGPLTGKLELMAY